MVCSLYLVSENSCFDDTLSMALPTSSSPRPGDLIPYYQLFWQIARRGKLAELTTRADVALRSPEYARWPFRARALPAMARIHALGVSLPTAQLEVIVSIHKSALDISQRSDPDPYIKPDREVLDAIWRTMTAALARNRNTWKSFAVGSDLIEQAVLLSRKFLDGDIVLFGPAIVAWQFLFSYEIATRSRTVDHAIVCSICSLKYDCSIAALTLRREQSSALSHRARWDHASFEV